MRALTGDHGGSGKMMAVKGREVQRAKNEQQRAMV